MLMRQIYEAAHEVVFDLGDFGSVEGQELDTLFESFFKFTQRRSKNEGIPAEESTNWGKLQQYGLPSARDTDTCH